MVSSKALDELIFWKENVRVLNESTFTSSLVMEKSIFCDASGAGFGGYVVGIQEREVVGSWSETESMLSSTWRELEAVYRTVHSSVTVSPNHVVCDVNFWYHRQLNHQQEASPRNFNQS